MKTKISYPIDNRFVCTCRTTLPVTLTKYSKCFAQKKNHTRKSDFPETDLVDKVNLLLHVTLPLCTDLNKGCVGLHFPFNFLL